MLNGAIGSVADGTVLCRKERPDLMVTAFDWLGGDDK